jgi:hypothetical protein
MTLEPGLMPILALSFWGMATCPLEDVVTTVKVKPPFINQSTIVWIGVPLFGKEGLGEIFRRCLLNYGLLSKG